MKPPFDASDKDALIASLMARVEVLVAQNTALVAQNAMLAARIAELEAKLGLPPPLATPVRFADRGPWPAPPKTPDNSSVPPSKGQKPSEPAVPKRKAKPHPGANRLLHPNPTRTHVVRALACQGAAPTCRGSSRALARPTTGWRSPRSNRT